MKMHPHHHAKTSVKIWGGRPEDYAPIHDWLEESEMSYFNKKTVTRDELIKMLNDMDMNLMSIEVEECHGGSLEIFVSAKDDEDYEDPSDYVGMGWVDSRGRP
jgi:hypothetical protein